MPRKSVQLGYCYGQCAIEKKECSTIAYFRSSAEMQTAAGAHGGNCLLTQSIHAHLLGKCNGEEGDVCSPNELSCDDSWIAYVDADNHDDDSCTVEDTVFGSCGNRCSWSPNSCLENEVWTFPSQGCSSDKVRVGACVKDNHAYCSVSEDSCDALSYFLNWYEVTDTMDVQCYLSREKIVISPPTASPSTLRLSPEEPSTKELGSTENLNKADTRNSAPHVVIIVTVVAIVTLSIVSFVTAYLLRKRQVKNNTPPRNVDIFIN